MGCSNSQKESTELARLPTVNGTLIITIINAKIEHETSTFFAMDPYIKIKMSNQSATTKVIAKGGKQPVFNQKHSFFINSCFKNNGRFLQIQLWDQNKTSDSLIGFGIADLDPILNSKSPCTNLRIFLNHELKPAGIVNVIAQFRQEPIQLVNFRFETASIRRKTSSIKDMNCLVQVTIGEQILKTKKQKDTKQLPPVWIDQILTFNVPKVIKNCLIEIYDNYEIVGQLTVNTEDLLKEKNEQNFDLQFDYKDVIAGTLKFQTLLGAKPQFSVIKRDYKRKPVEEKKVANPEEEKKEGEDKNEKKQEKKEVNDKKPQQAQQAKKQTA